MASPSSKLGDRQFEERAFLEFFFYQEPFSFLRIPSIDVYPEFQKVKVPIFENPTISESKSARLSRYKPIGRNGDLYSFLGSDSRQITLSFNMTLPHILDHAQLTTEVYKKKGYFDTLFNGREIDDAEKTKFEEGVKSQFYPTLSETDLLKSIKAYEEKMISELEKNPLGFGGITQAILNFTNLFGINDLDAARSNRLEGRLKVTKVKALYYFWTNILRTSTLGGPNGMPPPIIRLTFGPLFQRVPFIASKYSMSIDEQSGYDLLTLLPRRIKFSLNLEEIRMGNFSKYAPIDSGGGGYEVVMESENPADWSAVLIYGTTDPRLGPIGEDLDESVEGAT